MTKQVVKFKRNASDSQYLEDECYIIDTKDPNDLDKMFKEAMTLTKRHDATEVDEFYEAWTSALSSIKVCTSVDWRHSKGPLNPAQVAPAKDENGNYLLLDMRDKHGFFIDMLIEHGYLSPERKPEEMVDPGEAEWQYFEWLDKHTLNFNLTEINDQIIV